VLLGDVVVPDSVLRGRGLRALWEAQQGGTSGGLMQGGWATGSSTRQAAVILQASTVSHNRNSNSGAGSDLLGALPHSLALDGAGCCWSTCCLSCISISEEEMCCTVLPAALDMLLGPSSPSASKRGGSSQSAEVEEYILSMARSGFLTAPPQEFLALMTDWRTPRTATSTTAADR